MNAKEDSAGDYAKDDSADDYGKEVCIQEMVVYFYAKQLNNVLFILISLLFYRSIRSRMFMLRLMIGLSLLAKFQLI